MSTEEIQAWNRLIAEFDGWHFSKSGKTARKVKNGSAYRLKDIQYNTSWDWLMPVLEKIAKMGFIIDAHITAVTNSVFIIEAGNPENRLSMVYWSTPLKAVYEAAVSFITWHNTQHQ